MVQNGPNDTNIKIAKMVNFKVDQIVKISVVKLANQSVQNLNSKMAKVVRMAKTDKISKWPKVSN